MTVAGNRCRVSRSNCSSQGNRLQRAKRPAIRYSEVQQAGFTEPTPIQALTHPSAAAEFDEFKVQRCKVQGSIPRLKSVWAQESQRNYCQFKVRGAWPNSLIEPLNTNIVIVFGIWIWNFARMTTLFMILVRTLYFYV